MSSVESGQSSSTLRSERIAQGREFNAILQANGFPHAGSFPLYLRDECQPSVRAAALLTLLEPSGAKQGLGVTPAASRGWLWGHKAPANQGSYLTKPGRFVPAKVCVPKPSLSWKLYVSVDIHICARCS